MSVCQYRAASLPTKIWTFLMTSRIETRPSRLTSPRIPICNCPSMDTSVSASPFTSPMLTSSNVRSLVVPGTATVSVSKNQGRQRNIRSGDDDGACDTVDKHHACAGAIYFTDSLIPGVGYIDKPSGIHHNSTREVQRGGSSLTAVTGKTCRSTGDLRYIA